MKETLIIAGFGGQGVLSMGKILAYSGVMQDFEVTWMPSYGPEMRGGTANVTVILSDRKISSPIAHEFDTAIILNQQSMEKFEPMVKPGGVLIYDTNGITRHPVRKDIEVYAIDATAECAKKGQAKQNNTDLQQTRSSQDQSENDHRPRKLRSQIHYRYNGIAQTDRNIIHLILDRMATLMSCHPGSRDRRRSVYAVRQSKNLG